MGRRAKLLEELMAGEDRDGNLPALGRAWEALVNCGARVI